MSAGPDRDAARAGVAAIVPTVIAARSDYDQWLTEWRSALADEECREAYADWERYCRAGRPDAAPADVRLRAIEYDRRMRRGQIAKLTLEERAARSRARSAARWRSRPLADLTDAECRDAINQEHAYKARGAAVPPDLRARAREYDRRVNFRKLRGLTAEERRQRRLADQASRLARLPPADELKARREQLGQKLSDIADKIGVSASAVHTWETGLRVPRHDKITPYLGALGLTQEEG